MDTAALVQIQEEADSISVSLIAVGNSYNYSPFTYEKIAGQIGLFNHGMATGQTS